MKPSVITPFQAFLESGWALSFLREKAGHPWLWLCTRAGSACKAAQNLLVSGVWGGHALPLPEHTQTPAPLGTGPAQGNP